MHHQCFVVFYCLQREQYHDMLSTEAPPHKGGLHLFAKASLSDTGLSVAVFYTKAHNAPLAPA